MKPGQELEKMLQRLGPLEGQLSVAMVQKRLSRALLVALADEFERSAGLLRRIAGVRT